MSITKTRERTCTIALRVPASWREHYEREAVARGRTLSEHLRARLEAQHGIDATAPGLDELRQLIAEAMQQDDNGIARQIFEALEILRLSARPEHVKEAARRTKERYGDASQ